MSFISLSRLFLPISILLVVASVVLMFKPSPRLSIEFTGGTLMELAVPEGVTREELLERAELFQLRGETMQGVTASVTSTRTVFLRTPTLTNEEHGFFLEHLESLGEIRELQYTSIGPTVGRSLKQRAFWALLAASIAIIAYVAFAFRRIPRSLNPWSFGVAAIAALIHDIAIVMGIFTILSYTTTFQVDTLFISALLSIMGYSVSDTIVIFDRIRDNLATEGKNAHFPELAERSLRQSLSRTLNTGLGALIMLFALFFFGAESIRWFILALIIGTIVGTYSSFFIATPLLVFWKQRWKA